jgi:glycine oxidase
VPARPERADAVIIGGGVIGCSIAWRLAERGLSVTVIERGLPGKAASWAAAGMLSPLGETRQHPDFLALAQASRSRYPAFLDELQNAAELDIEFGAPGKLEVAFDADELHALGAAFHGLPVRVVGAPDVHRLEPALAQGIKGGIWFEQDAFVDNRRLAEALWTAGLRRGVRFRTGDAATGLCIEAGRTSAVRLSSGDIPCKVAVISSGAWSAQLQNLPRPLPVFPVRGQMLALQTLPSPLTHIVQSSGCYLIPRAGDRVLVGGTVERVGFDSTITPVAIQQLRSAATRLLPALASATVEATWCGLRPCTPDELPILGSDPDVHGLYYATGHYRNGILLAPITADLISALICGSDTLAQLNTFRIDRFAHEQAHATV